MSISKYILKLLAYDDAATTNDPQKINFDYNSEWDETITKSTKLDLACAAGSTTIPVPTGTKFLAVYTDQTIVVKQDSLTGITVTPSVAGTQDGILFVRIGTLTTLAISNAGTVTANVKIFATL